MIFIKLFVVLLSTYTSVMFIDVPHVHTRTHKFINQYRLNQTRTNLKLIYMNIAQYIALVN